ncbi:MAG: hypothetical protein PVF58_15055 [Candidatus Methanofastidiosia archaeon]|jgi:hypothetical protein
MKEAKKIINLERNQRKTMKKNSPKAVLFPVNSIMVTNALQLW